jgi:cytochrome c2
MKRRGIAWPKFEGNEMVDIIVYIKNATKSGDKIFISPGDPKIGKTLFAKKRCSLCHSTKEGDKKIGPSLGKDLRKKEVFPRTVTQVAGLMWNHAPKMWKEIKEKGLKRPELNPQEMADLIAYLFSLQYFDEPGNREKGSNVFKEKHCIKCHAVNGKGGLKGPDLMKWSHQVTPISMAQAMWNHGPSMLEEMKKMGLSWPKFEGTEIVDLMEYLKNLPPR